MQRRIAKIILLLGLMLTISGSYAQSANEARAMAYIEAANYAIDQRNYQDALHSIDKARDLVGRDNALCSSLKVKVYMAQGDYSLAQQELNLFYTLKSSPQMKSDMGRYQITLDKKADERAAALKRERNAWRLASTENTEAAYNHYLDTYPRGEQVNEAKSRYDRLKSQRQAREQQQAHLQSMQDAKSFLLDFNETDKNNEQAVQQDIVKYNNLMARPGGDLFKGVSSHIQLKEVLEILQSKAGARDKDCVLRYVQDAKYNSFCDMTRKDRIDYYNTTIRSLATELNNWISSATFSVALRDGLREEKQEKCKQVLNTEYNVPEVCGGSVPGELSQKEQEIADLIAKANKGDSEAQLELGVRFDRGLDVEKSQKKALEWYTKAANNGNINAQIQLGYMYESGIGTEENQLKAIEWYTKAAEQGNIRSQSTLANMYEFGTGTEQDLAKAIDWHTKAAEQGDAFSQYRLGFIYRWGKDTDINVDKAFEWFSKAAEQGHGDAQAQLGYLYQQGSGTDKSLKDAFNWYQKSASQGNEWGQYLLAEMYEKGQGIEKDLIKAKDWYTKAAAQGNKQSQEALERF